MILYFKNKGSFMKKIQFQLFITSLFILNTFYTFPENKSEIIRGTAGSEILVQDFGIFNEPWAMTFMPDGDILITEKSGNLYIYNKETQTKQIVSGVPAVAYGGQGGLGDIILHPDFVKNNIIYLSFVEEDLAGKRGAAVAISKIHVNDNGASLEDFKIIWRQIPKVSGNGHYSHRLVFDSQGYLFIASGERQKQWPAQDWNMNLGKIIRLNADGTVPRDNPFQNKGELAKTFWTIGHRNILGIDFDKNGKLWAHEMGPLHGDEFNNILKGDNYGWPLVSWGNQYSGADIPDHDTRPDFHEPEEFWVPSIAPSGLIIYKGGLFQLWKNDAIIGGLVSKSIVRVRITGIKASEIERFYMKKRIREVEQGPDGAIWILEDRRNARLRKIIPK